VDHENLRNEMIATCRFINDRGINQGTSGNHSARVPGGFLITASGIPYDEMVPGDIAMMHLDATHEGAHRPSSECWHALPVGTPFVLARAIKQFESYRQNGERKSLPSCR
jgi:hypothetical protein